MPIITEEPQDVEALYLKYYADISGLMMDAKSPFKTMTDKLLTQFKLLGLTNEEKANALVAIYSEETKSINAESSKAALNLIKQRDDSELSEAKVATEERKARGYDDNIMIEIMKAQSGLASFAVNANSSTAQDTINDLHTVMDTVKNRVCHYSCDTTSFVIDKELTYNETAVGYVYGGTGPLYAIVEYPAKGIFTVDELGQYSYTPVADETGMGEFTGIISGVDSDSGFTVTTRINFTVTDIV